MTSTKKLASGALLAMVLPLAACSGGSDAAYCDAIKASSKQLDGNSAKLGDKDGMRAVVASFQKVEAVAPAEIKAEWTTMRSVLEKFTADQPDMQELAGQADKIKAAGAKIEKHVKDSCGVDLNTLQ